MAYEQPTAPHVNGVMDLTETQKETLLNQLSKIKEDFVPSHEQPVCDTFYLVVEHTKKHGEQVTFTQLNGDTAEYILSQENVSNEVV